MGMVAMSYRTDWADCQGMVRAIDNLMNSDFGDHASEVSMALTVLEGQLEVAWRAIRVAMHSAIAERHELARDEALAEVARITAITAGDDA